MSSWLGPVDLRSSSTFAGSRDEEELTSGCLIFAAIIEGSAFK